MDTIITKSLAIRDKKVIFPKKPPLLFLILSFLLLMLISPVGLSAQKAEIKGKVIDKTTNKPLVGATVTIKSIRLGAITDKDGNYSFKAPEGKYYIRAKFIGYEDGSRPIRLKPGKTYTINFALSTGGVTTDEVVVVGLTGEVDRNKLGNIISTVDSKEIAKVVSSSAIDGISGRVAGVQVTRNSGTPGAGTYITMRGRSTILGSSEPLYVIDGIIMDNSSLYDPSGTQQFSNRAVDINPLDIESIEILKGPAAAAIYGSQAANGVVLITTKRGHLSPEGKPARITYSSSIQADQKYGEVPLQTTYGQIPGTNYSYGEKLPAGTKTYNQADVPFRTGISNTQSLTLSGGVPQFDYLLNGTVEDVQGYVEGSTYKRNSFRANVGASILPGVSIQSNNNYISINNDLPQDGSNVSGILLGALRTPPEFNNKEYLNPDGTQRSFGYYDNPIWSEKFNTFNSKIERFLHSTELKWKPIYWMTITSRFGLDKYEYINQERQAVGSATSDNRQGYISHQDIKNQKMNFDFTGTFNYVFMDNQLQTNLVLGSQIIWDKNSQDWLDGSVTLPFYDQISAAATRDGTSTLYETKTVGLFAQLTSTLWNRLSLTLAIRRDGSSTFGKSQKFHYYPKAGFSYTLSDEPFMKSTKNIFSNIRLRGSFGEAGSPGLPGAYATNFLYGTGGFFSPWDRGSQAQRGGYLGIRQGGGATDAYVLAGAENINPELSVEREIGIDLGFLDNRVTLQATYYYKNVFDMILNVPVPSSSGYDQQLRNAAAMWNKGFELTLNATPILEDNFVWNFTINYSTNTNQVTKLEGADFISLSGGFVGINNVAIEGKQLGVFRGYGFLHNTDGSIVHSQWDENNKQIYYVDPETGNKIYGDQYGMGYVGAPIHDANLEVIGNPNPDYMLSFRSDLTLYQDFTFSFLIDAVQGFDVWNGTRGALFNFGTHGDTEDRDKLWVNDAGKQVKIAQYDENGNFTGFENATKQEKYWTYENGFLINEPHIEDGSFVKLREVSLSYNWHGLEEWNISAIRFTLTARNLLTITNYSGFDPEVNTFGVSEGRGLDYFTLPQTTSYRFGISIIY